MCLSYNVKIQDVVLQPSSQQKFWINGSLVENKNET